MTSLTVTWGHIEGLRRFDNALKAVDEKVMHRTMQRALARAGDTARTQVRRVLTKQTGLPRAVIVRAVKVKRPHYGDFSYTMTTRGGDISLKYFKARETRKGVSAAPFGQRRIFEHTFIMGGRFPSRKPLNMGGNVFARVADVRFPIEKQTSGVIIPAEMVKGETKRAFEETVARVLPGRVEHEITRATKGAVS